MGRDLAEIPLTMASLRLWSQMNERTGEETGWRRTGITYLCYNKRGMEIWGGWYEKGKAYGLNSEMLTGPQVEALLPGSSGGLIGGPHTPSDGRAEPVYGEYLSCWTTHSSIRNSSRCGLSPSGRPAVLPKGNTKTHLFGRP